MTKALWCPYNSFTSTAKLRLFCFSHAGGAASSFRSWQSFFPSYVEICPIQLPGRENRFKEPFITNMDDLIDKMWPYISVVLDYPFAFFGHSLGGLIAFELAKKIQQENRGTLLNLFISAASAPNYGESTHAFHQLPDDQFIQHLRKYGGMPEQILQDADALNVFLPRLRADFTLFETYRNRVPFPINAPIRVFGGNEDYLIALNSLQAWEKYTKTSFTIQLFPGNHFYLQKRSQVLCQTISAYLNAHIDL